MCVCLLHKLYVNLCFWRASKLRLSAFWELDCDSSLVCFSRYSDGGNYFYKLTIFQALCQALNKHDLIESWQPTELDIVITLILCLRKFLMEVAQGYSASKRQRHNLNPGSLVWEPPCSNDCWMQPTQGPINS